MPSPTRENDPYQLDERTKVELPLLEQLRGLGWEVRDLDRSQKPEDSYRESFGEVVLLPILRRQLQVINPWLDEDQVEEVIKRLTGSFPTQALLENNRHVHNLLLGNTSVAENRHTGERSPTVRYVDFDTLQNNSFLAVCQFKVRIIGSDHHIIPDIVLFLNGLPLVVIECKSQMVKEPIPEAIDQLMRYSEQRGYTGEGRAELFFYNQLIIATCRTACKFGTITTHNEKHFYRWADPYPRTLNDLDHGSSAPNDQQRLAAGMLDRRNLLDLLRTFIVFAEDDKGETIKIVGRYQQFRAVKLAVRRLMDGATPRARGGIIWHTQGSGKSLTMMFMVREMYCAPQLAGWKVVFVTDRTQLQEQLLGTGSGVGYTIKVADSIADLKRLLRNQTADLVLAMVQKFQEAEITEVFPLLDPRPNVLVMIDEAHRSVYKELGANLDKALPSAARIAYTGTPIDKTERVFGEYIDKYTMREAIDDGVTLEIVYEGRTAEATVIDPPNMDTTFADVFSDYKMNERLQILGYGARDAYLEAKEVIAAKAKDMVRHYLDHVFPNGFKAQVVASSREAAVRYKDALDRELAAARAALRESNPLGLNLERLECLRTDVVISGSTNDTPDLKPYTSPSRHKETIKSFKLPFDRTDEGVRGDVGIVVVNNMLLTGFDAPIEQVMYLDQVIVAHNLLQAIARVNRVAGRAKEKGFVVDYVGVGHHLKRALDDYDAREQAEILDALSFPEKELRALEDAHRAIRDDLLARHGLTDLADHDAFFDLFYDEDIRFEYIEAFRKFTACLNVLFPAKEALAYMEEYKALAAINALAARHLGDGKLSMKGIPAKLRAITDQHLSVLGIEQKVEPISILDKDFQAEVNSYSRAKTKAAAVEHAIRHHIEVELDDDPELQASFAAALAAILAEFKDSWEQIYIELEKLRARMAGAASEPTYGLNRKKEMPFFRMLRGKLYGAEGELSEEQISLLVALTKEIVETIAVELRLAGFWDSTPARNRLGSELQKLLLSEDYKAAPQIRQQWQAIVTGCMELAKKNHDTIVHSDEPGRTHD